MENSRTLAKTVGPGLEGSKVTLLGWVKALRDIGAMKFLVIRDFSGTAQVTAGKKFSTPEILAAIASLGNEDVVSVEGSVKKNAQAPDGAEVIPEKIVVVNKAEVPLPIDVSGKLESNLDTRLDWRVLDLRMPVSSSIFKIQSCIVSAFREFFRGRDYVEIQPPCIIGSASEGGSELFPIPYFEKEAFLAQSPQLYKQMCAMAFEKVFMTVPVFRAEKFDQPTHLNELRQLDAEQAFTDDEGAIDILEGAFSHILNQVKMKCGEELHTLGVELEIPMLPLRRVTYKEAIGAVGLKWGDDFSKTHEKELAKIFGNAFFLKDWPTEIKAFYSMPREDTPEVCRAFDLLHNGLEISSGTQRIHIPELLTKQIAAKGLNPENFKSYIDQFRYGAPPHAGWSIGLERITMTITGRKNIRECCLFPRDRNRITP